MATSHGLAIYLPRHGLSGFLTAWFFGLLSAPGDILRVALDTFSGSFPFSPTASQFLGFLENPFWEGERKFSEEGGVTNSNSR